MKVAQVFVIRDLFRLSDGITVFACDRGDQTENWTQRKVRIVSDGKVCQEVLIKGERTMSRQSVNLDKFAIETELPIHLSTEDAQSGQWAIVVE